MTCITVDSQFPPVLGMPDTVTHCRRSKCITLLCNGRTDQGSSRWKPAVASTRRKLQLSAGLGGRYEKDSSGWKPAVASTGQKLRLSANVRTLLRGQITKYWTEVRTSSRSALGPPGTTRPHKGNVPEVQILYIRYNQGRGYEGLSVPLA